MRVEAVAASARDYIASIAPPKRPRSSDTKPFSSQYRRESSPVGGHHLYQFYQPRWLPGFQVESEPASNAFVVHRDLSVVGLGGNHQ